MVAGFLQTPPPCRRPAASGACGIRVPRHRRRAALRQLLRAGVAGCELRAGASCSAPPLKLQARAVLAAQTSFAPGRHEPCGSVVTSSSDESRFRSDELTPLLGKSRSDELSVGGTGAVTNDGSGHRRRRLAAQPVRERSSSASACGRAPRRLRLGELCWPWVGEILTIQSLRHLTSHEDKFAGQEA